MFELKLVHHLYTSSTEVFNPSMENLPPSSANFPFSLNGDPGLQIRGKYQTSERATYGPPPCCCRYRDLKQGFLKPFFRKMEFIKSIFRLIRQGDMDWIFDGSMVDGLS
jgi:hypothetical protein